MPVPILGAAAATIGRKLLGKAARKVIPAVARAVGNKVVRRAAKTAVGAAVTTGTVSSVLRSRSRARGNGGGAAVFGGVQGGSSSSAPGGFRKIRRMNPSNPKALRRAVRRVDKAKDMYGKVLSAMRPTSHSGFKIKPKKGKR